MHDNPTTTPYIDYSNDYIVPVPGMAAESWLYCFPVHGEYDKIQAIIDQRLNFSPLNKDTKFFAISDFMMLVMSDIKKGYSLDPNYTKYGYLEERAMQIFVPLIECKLNSKGEWSAQRLIFHIPYIFVDQPFNLGIGREEFGFSKAMANFDFPTSPKEADTFKFSPYGFKAFNKENPEFGNYHELISITKKSDTSTAGEWKTHKEVWDVIKPHLEIKKEKSEIKYGLKFILNELKDLKDKALPLIFLKQFRDITIPENACYQAITEGNGVVDNLNGGWFLGDEYEISIQDFASFPIMSDLGLPSNISVKHPFWVHLDMQFNTGTVLWSNK